MLLTEAVDLFLTSRAHIVAPPTLKNNRIYLAYLSRGFTGCRLCEITLHDLRQWRASLFDKNTKYENATIRKPVTGKLSIYTIFGILGTCRQFFRWCVAEDLLEKSPAARLELPALPEGPPKMLADADLDKLLEAARSTPGEFRRLRNVALLLFLRDTGCRVGGASGLRMDRLDLKGGRAWVTEKGKGGGKTRAVFLTKEAVTALEAWLAVHPGFAKRRAVREKGQPECAGAFVFVSERHPYPAMTRIAVHCVLKALKKKAGITGRANAHSFRHRRAKTMLQNGAPLGLVSRILGHSDIRVTDKNYGIYAENELKEGFDRYA